MQGITNTHGAGMNPFFYIGNDIVVYHYDASYPMNDVVVEASDDPSNDDNSKMDYE